MHYYPTLEDSGEYYILPRPPGDSGPPQFVKRPHPAPTSTQLPDDFDALTQGATTTAYGAASEWAGRVRDSGMASMNPAPLVDDFDAMTWTHTAGGGTVTRRTSRFHANTNGYHANGHTSGARRGDWENKAPKRTTDTYMASTSTSARIPSNSRNPRNGKEGGLTSAAGQHKSGERKAARRKPSLVDLANRPEPTSYVDSSPHVHADHTTTPHDIQILIDAASCSTAIRRNNTSTSGRRRASEIGAAATSSRSASAYRTAPTHQPASPKSPGRKLSSSRHPGHSYPHPYHTSSPNSPPRHLQSSSSRTRHTALEYRLVDHKIIEDGPERTVTISKWREDLSGRHGPDVEMSVYFVNPDEYEIPSPDEEIAMVERSDVEMGGDDEADELRDVMGTPASLKRRGYSKGKMKSHSSTSALAQSIRQTSSEPIDSMRTKTSTQLDPHQTHRSHSPFATKSKKDAHPAYRSHHPPQPHEDRYYRISKQRGYEYYNDPHDVHDPVHDIDERPRPPRPTRPRNMYESPPEASRYQREPRSPSPFHATVSGSTISSIKHPSPSPPPSPISHPHHTHRPRTHARGRSNSDHPMQNAQSDPITSILSTCTPSLEHLAPILLNLGIRSEAHLRALAKMSKEIRNKEVRGEALKRGVQVVEWAMLCDLLKEYK